MQPRQRATFDPTDLAIVLSHYDLGVIESITDFPRGSRRSAKVGVVSERGKFLLKQRSLARAKPQRVAAAHRVQAHLAPDGFPMPKLIAPRSSAQAFVTHRDHIHELFEFVAGHPYARTPAESFESGATLARFHALTQNYAAPAGTPLATGDLHDAPGVRVGLCSIGSTLSSHESFTGEEAELATLVAFLLDAYDTAAGAANQLGFAQWPLRVVHADWHPGNLLFRDQKVVAVVDYDSVRQSRAVTDIANGALHFSLIAGDDPTEWPDHLDEDLFLRFLQGYLSKETLTQEQRLAIPHLMAEALIAECVPPITETGSVGRWSGFRVLKMVKRKITWLSAHQERLIRGIL